MNGSRTVTSCEDFCHASVSVTTTMAALQRNQLDRLCSSSDTLEKANSILRLANAKTRQGSGFVVKNTIAIPAVCAYLASEQYAFPLSLGILSKEYHTD